MKKPSYIETISRFYPDISAYTVGSEYSDIVWQNGGPVQQNILDNDVLTLTKEYKIRELSGFCENAIVSGFLSSALGHDHIYDSEEVDQINILGALLSTFPNPLQPDGGTIYYACRDADEDMKEYEPHTFYQIMKVVQDGAAFKLMQLQKLFSMKIL